VHTLIAAHGRLWIGYGDRILTLSKDGKLASFARLAGVVATVLPTFCIAGTTLYAADGTLRQGIDVAPGAPRSFLQSPGSLSAEESGLLLQMKAALMQGTYCGNSPGFGPVIYTLAVDIPSGKPMLYEIRPK
jgi:hypothetical protein